MHFYTIQLSNTEWWLHFEILLLLYTKMKAKSIYNKTVVMACGIYKFLFFGDDLWLRRKKNYFVLLGGIYGMCFTWVINITLLIVPFFILWDVENKFLVKCAIGCYYYILHSRKKVKFYEN